MIKDQIEIWAHEIAGSSRRGRVDWGYRRFPRRDAEYAKKSQR